MTLTISTPHDTGSISSASGTTVNLASGTAVSSWIGRLLVINRRITDNPRSGQHRKITAVPSSSQVTIESSWRTAVNLGFDCRYVAQTESIDTATNRITISNHEFRDEEWVGIFTDGGTLPGGTSDTVIYYINIVDDNTIELHTNEAVNAIVDITSVGSGNIYIVRDPDLEAIPENSDPFHISLALDDIDDGTNIEKVDARLYRNLDGLTLSGDVTIFDESIYLDLDNCRISNGTPPAPFTLNSTAGLILGNYGISRVPEFGCTVRFEAPSLTGLIRFLNSSSTAVGDLIFNGCIVLAETGANDDLFFGLTGGASQQVRFLSCIINGYFPVRFNGTRSNIFRTDLTNYVKQATTSNRGPFEFTAPNGSIQESRITDSSQVVSVNWDLAKNLDLQLSVKNIFDQVVQASNFFNTAVPYTLDLVNFQYESLPADFIRWTNPQTSRNKTIRIVYELRVRSLFNGVLSAGSRIAVFDSTGAETFNQVSSGVFPTVKLVERFWTEPTGSGVRVVTFASGTTRTPHTVVFRHYGFFSLEQVYALSDLSAIVFDWNKVQNTLLTAADAATALSVTDPTTLNEIYDHAQATYEQSGNMQFEEKITASGVTVTFALNVLIDSTLNAVIYDLASDLVSYSEVVNGASISVASLASGQTLTLNQSGDQLANWSIPATGTVVIQPGDTDLSTFTFANGSTLSLASGTANVTVSSNPGIVTVGAGTINIIEPVLSVSITGLVPTSRLKIFNAGTTTLVDGINSSTTQFTWIGGTVGNLYDIYIVLPGRNSIFIPDFEYPITSGSLLIEQSVDINYSATGASYDLDLSGGAGLGTTTDLWLDTANREFQLATGNNLSQPTGIPFQDFYSRVIEARYANDSLMPYHDPVVCIDADAGKYEFRGWSAKNTETLNLLRTGGVAQYSITNVLEAEWMGLVGLGNLFSQLTPYFWQEDSTNPTITDCINPGLPNQLIQIFGDASNGNFDRRSFFVISARAQGEDISTYDLINEQNLTTLTPRVYSAVLATSENTNITVNDVGIDSDSNGVADQTPYDGMSITWLTSAAVDDWTNSTVYSAFSIVESNGSFYITTEGGTSDGTAVSDDVGVTWYEVNTIYDANNGNLEQMTNYLFWAQRQTTDIDNGTGVRTGKVVDSLAITRGSILVLRPGLWAINFNLDSQLTHIPVEVDGTERPYQPPPPVISIVGFPTGATVTLSQAGRTLDVLNNATSPYTYVTQDSEDAVYRFVVSASGFQNFVVDLDTNQSLVSTYIGVPGNNEQIIDATYTNFFELMSEDIAFLRIVGEDTSLNRQGWSIESYKEEWNTAVVADSPSLAEISAWSGYLVTTEYSLISFNSSTGEVN